MKDMYGSTLESIFVLAESNSMPHCNSFSPPTIPNIKATTETISIKNPRLNPLNAPSVRIINNMMSKAFKIVSLKMI